MRTEAIFDVVDIHGGRVAVVERNTLMHWFFDLEQDARDAVSRWKGMVVGKPSIGRPTQQGRKRSVTLEATFACNLRCTYCFMSEDPDYVDCSKHMDFQTARDYLAKYANHSDVDQLGVSFLGGEPTLNMDLICRVVDHVRRNYGKRTFSVTTNGTQFSKKLRDAVTFDLNPKLGDISIGEWMSRHGFGVTLSMDGPRDVHDRCRIGPSGAGSFDEIMRNLESVKACAPKWMKRFTIRCTLGDDIVEDGHGVLDRLRFFNGMIDDGYAGSVHIEPAKLLPATLPHLSRQYEEASEWFIEEVKAGRRPRWGDMEKVLSALYRKRPKAKNCGAGANYLTCGINGEIYACHRTLGAKIGTVAEGIDAEAASQWEDNRVYWLPACSDCEAKHLCGGGCRAAGFAEHGTTREPSETNCFVKKLRMRCALRMIDAMSEKELDAVCPAQKQNHKRAKKD